MEDLSVGDRISVTFDDMPRDQITATVSRTLSDTEEGLGPEIEDYIAYWIEISRDGDPRATISNVVLLTTGRYSLDGRSVTIRKIGGSNCP
ncbi:MAG TPA: hypothetical protein VH350_12890 [Candidatus Sulfotelmatobacter sp.]|jgi:hypothetical protein|nr:hypothetical protein [Candidatus Sulfotelmatobacter sp.]